MFQDAEIVSRYTRAQAIADGMLKDLSAYASRIGFRYPVAVTTTAHAEVSEAFSAHWPAGTYHPVVTIANILTALQAAIADQTEGSERVTFSVAGVQLYALCGPDDNAEPVITVMLVGED